MNTSKLKGSLANGCRRLAALLHHGFAVTGVVFVAFFVYEGARLAALPTDRSALQSDSRDEGENHRVADASPAQRALAHYLSRRYRVAADATEHLVAIAFGAGKQVGLDPLLILAVMAVESKLNPIAESVMGAKGLMQVIPKHHQDKLEKHGGEQALLDPVTNVQIGARILKEYILRSGSLEGGLQWYNGAALDLSSQYAEKVIAEQQRLRQAISRPSQPVNKASSA
ncbi:MAG: hypothetical protein A3I01_09925 [Betaproteobacteria bacterium RIFCSPLOWO2_02_FULL_65_24]|nr:MAG: hypothetical protein A3I01_09925 [Betaproteobacteria bacterium RIFCSPLOWO2_02_FULL_65_24]OGA36649.1 MAG: hypothetical protein A3G80_11375 [Betaproteobacteria bacterium RIFCSPLOWO2_12_FULL_62_13b]